MRAKRALKTGGLLRFCVPDFEDYVKKWIEAEDNWKIFRDDVSYRAAALVWKLFILHRE